MATRIPTYQRSVGISEAYPAARAQSNVSASDPIGAALSNIGQQGQQMVETYKEKENKELENKASVDVSNILSQGDVYWQQNTTERFKAYKVGDADMREGLGKDFDAWQNENEAKLITPKAKMYFREHTNRMKATLQQGAYKFQEGAATSKQDAESSAGEQADENSVFNDGSKFDEVYTRRVEAMLARSDLSEAKKIEKADGYRRKLSFAKERGELERNPAGWYKERFGEYKPGVAGTGASGGGTVSSEPTAGSRAVADAIYGQESSSGKANTSAVNSQNVTGPMQMQEGTFNAAKAKGLIPADAQWKNPADNKAAGYAWVEYLGKKYNGDADKVAAAYYGGEGAVNSDGSINRQWRNKQRPQDPSVGEYIDQVRARMEKNGKNPVVAVVASNGDVPVGGAAPAAAAASPINAPKTFGGMDWEQQLALKTAAETKLKQAEALFRSSADRQMQDASAMHADGIVDPFNLPRAHFDRAYGAEGARMFDEYTKSRDMGADIGRFKTQSAAEIAAELQTDKPVPGAGYATDDARYNTRVKAASAVMQQRENDPVGYVTKNNPELKRQREAIDNPQMPPADRPAAVQQYVRDSLAEQQRLGISKPQILSPGQTDAIAARAMQATKPEDSANLIAGLEHEYGPQLFPKVFDQLVKEGKVSAELLIIPNLPSQTSREMVSRLARIKEADLTAGIEHADQKVVKDAVTAELEKFAKAVPIMTPQAASVTNSYESTLRKMAYSFVGQGQKPADAVQNATKMVLGHYEFDGSTRYPKGTDISMMKYGTGVVLEKELGDIDVPSDMTRSRTPEAARKEWTGTVQSNAQWYTSDDDGGLELWSNGSNGVRYRVTRGGQPVKYTWADLKAKQPAGFEFGGLFKQSNANAYQNEQLLQKRQADEARIQARAAASAMTPKD